MVEFGAPTLMGLKPASLFRYRVEIPAQADRNILQLGRELAPFGLTLRVLHVWSRTDARVLYVYRAVWLRQILADCGLPETVRGERLGLEEFAALARARS